MLEFKYVPHQPTVTYPAVAPGALDIPR
jgi:hypothetical protein